MKVLACLILGAIVLPSVTQAQAPESATRPQLLDRILVRGVVLDEATGRPLQSARVIAPGQSIGTVTDTDGHYVLRDLPNRNQALRVTLPGYIPETRDLWVCTPVLHPGGTCTAGTPEPQELRFYLRRAPAPVVR